MFTELKAVWKEYKSEVKEIWNEEMGDYHPVEEIKVVWKDAWAEYRVVCDEARAERQFERHQRAIDTLAIQAQLEIDELKYKYPDFT